MAGKRYRAPMIKHLAKYGLVEEWQFAHGRLWRLDFGCPRYKVALEVQGGLYISGGHVRGDGFQRDREKVLAAQMHGILVAECSPKHIEEYAIKLARFIESGCRTISGELEACLFALPRKRHA